MKKAILLSFLCLCFGFAFGQSNGSYRSRQTGDWSQVATWQVFNSGWFDLESPGAGVYQNSIPSSLRGIISISTGTIVTIPGGLEVDADQLEFGPNATLHVDINGILNIRPGSGHDVRLYNDGSNFSELLVNGYVRLHKNATIVNDNYAGAVIPASNSTTVNTYKVLNGGVHIHASADPLPYADWQTGSTLTFYATNVNPIITDLSVEFYNFVWDGREQSQNMHFFGRLRNVAGHLTIFSTNNRTLHFGTNTAYTLNIGRNFSVLGNAQVYLTNSSTAILNIGSSSDPGNLQISAGTLVCAVNGAATLNVSGDMIVTGGTANLRNQSGGGGGITNINLTGDLTQSGGLVTRSVSAGTANINFVGSGTTSVFSKTGGSIANAVNFAAQSGKTLDLGEFALTGSGTFTASSGSFVHLKSADALGAIQNNTTGGNIRVSGIRTFQTGSTLVYDGTSTQAMGAGHPPSANTRINNPAFVYMISNATVNGTLSTPQPLIIDGNTLTIGGAYQRENGYIGITPASNLTINGTGDLNDLLLAPVVSTSPPNPMNNLTINRFGTVRLAYDLIVGGTYTLTLGTLLIGEPYAFSLTLRGNVVRTSGALAVVHNPNLTIEGTGSLPSNFPITVLPNSWIGALTMNRPSATFSTNSALSLDTINLFSGVVNNTASNLSMRSDGLVVRRSGGSINQVLSAVDTYDVHYEVNSDIVSGNELPNAATTLGDLTKMGTATVTLVKDVTVNGTFTIDDGIFDAGTDNDITINEDFVVDGVFEPREGLVTFGGTAQNISGSANIEFYDLLIDQSSASTVSLATNVDIENSLDINGASTLQAGNEQLRLLSTPAKTANVYRLPDDASITGSVIVQRFLPKVIARRSFFYMASPVTDSDIPDWADELPLAKVHRWHEPIRGYVVVDPNSTILPGRGFAVDVASTETFTYDVRGTLQIGDIGVPVTTQSPIVSGPDGWNLVGNPYPSAIAWDSIARPAGIYNAMYITDNFNNSGLGTALERRVTYIDGVGVPAGYKGEIAQGQAFWIKATANTTLTFTEEAKIRATDKEFYRKGEIPNVLRIKLDGMGAEDEAVVRLREGATDGFDEQFDAYKFLKGDLNLATLTNDNVQTVINAYGTTDCNKNIPIVAEGIKKGTYTFNFKGMESFDAHVAVSLIDQNQKKSIDIRQNPVYSFVVEDTSTFAMRFELAIMANTTPVNVSISAAGERLCDDGSDAIITLDSSEPGVEYSVVWEGQKISEKILGTGAPIKLSVNTEQLPLGETKVNVQAESGMCSSMSLTQMPIIEKIGKGQVTSVKDGIICDSGTATLVASGSDANGWYNWYESEDATNPIQNQHSSELVTLNLNKSKTYYVSVVNALGCEGDRMAVKAIVSRKQEVELVADGSTLISNIDEGNRWYFNDTVIDGATSNTLTAIESGLYTVKVGIGACESESSYEISIADEQGITVYPNPVAEKVFVQIRSKNTEVAVSIVNSQGVAVETKLLRGETEVKEGEFDLLPYAAGVYQLRFEDGRRIVTKKIVKLK